MKIVIIGVTGFRNRGVEALVRPTLDLLLERFPKALITVATWSPDYDLYRYRHSQVEFVEDPFLRYGSWSSPRKARSLGRRVLNRVARKIGLSVNNRVAAFQSLFPKTDLLVVSGGDLLSSDYGTASLQHFLDPVLWAAESSIPCFLMGQSIGPFKNSIDKEIFLRGAKAASLITMREPLSYSYVVDSLGVPASKVLLTADIAFLLKPDERFASHNVGRCGSARPLVGLSISESICKWTGGNYDRHLEVWCMVIRRMIEEWDVDVAIIPHVQEAFSDDRVVATKIVRRLGFPENVRLYAEDLTAAEYKGILMRCQLVIAERMHVAIGALSSGVCSVPISYSVKAQGVIQSVLEGSAIASEDLVIPLGEFLKMENIWERLGKVWVNRDLYREKIRGSLDRSCLNAARNVELIETLEVKGE